MIEPYVPASRPGDLQELAPRYQAVAAGVLAGKTNRQIGEALDLKEPTIASYLQEIYTIIGCRGRVNLVKWATGAQVELDPPIKVKSVDGSIVSIPESEIIGALGKVTNYRAILAWTTAWRADRRVEANDTRRREAREWARQRKIMDPRTWRSPGVDV